MSIDNFFLRKENAALVIVDIQERLAAAMSEKQKVLTNTLHLIEAAKLLALPLLVTEQYPKGLGPTVPEIREAIQVLTPVEKITFSCCGEQLFVKAVRDASRKQIILVGMETHVCILQTCLDLLKEGYAVHVVSDGVCSRSKQCYTAGIEFMRDAGAVITCAETVLFQLLEKAGSEEFKVISRRIK